jgi:hypothetical protein
MRLSLREYLGDLPPEVEQMYAQAIAPDARMAARIFLPTRPTLFGDRETARLTIVVPGLDEIRSVAVHTRLRGGGWISKPATLVQRRTYEAVLGPFAGMADYVQYYATAALADRSDPVATLPVSATVI